MSPYSFLFLSAQNLNANIGAHTLTHTKVKRSESKQASSGKQKVIVATSAPSFFSLGPEEEVFDMELEGGCKSSALMTPDSPSYRGNKTPGSKISKKPATPKAPKCRKSSVEFNRATRLRSFQCEEVMEYAVDTYLWKIQLESKYRALGRVPTDSDVTEEMRHTLLQWLSNVARQQGFSLETWCLSVNYLDRFLQLQPLDRECLQLVGLTSLLLAAKIEEQNPPEILELVELCASAYTRTNFRHMEVIMLSKLEFQLLAPTPSFLLHHLLQIRGEKEWPVDLSRHMVEMCLCNDETSRYTPSVIAHSIFTVIKGSNSAMISEVSRFCPICHPAVGDIYTREFVICCFENITSQILNHPHSSS